MNGRTVTGGLIAAALAAVSAGCSSSLDVPMGTARVTMTRDTAAAPAPAPSYSTEGAQAIPQDTVQSLVVTVVGVDILMAGGDETEGSAWQSVDLASSVDLDLMALPTESTAAELVASGEVRAGTYTHIRLRVTNPRIVFKGDISFGLDGTLEGGTEYEVVVPSSAQSGIKVAVGVTVEADATSDVELAFSSLQTLSNVAVTGTGQVMLSPVIKAR